MSSIDENSIEAFRDEFRKISALNPFVGSAATLGAVGGLGGGALGYQRARAEGEGVGASLKRGLKGALVGGSGGALLGAGAAAVRPGMGTSISNFGQRQVHGLTGWTPAEGVRSIGHGAADSAERLQAAHQALGEASHAHAAASFAEKPPGVVGRLLGKKAPVAPTGANLERFQGMNAQQIEEHLGKAKSEHGSALASHAASEKAEQMGLTSLPGYLKSMKNNGVLPTLTAGANQGWAGTSAGSKAMMLGLPALGVAGAVRGADAPDQSGKGKAERIGSVVGDVAGNIVGAPIPFVGGQVLGEGFKRTGGLIGKGVDKVRGHLKPQGAPGTDLTQGTGQASAAEHVMTSRAQGTALEGGV